MSATLNLNSRQQRILWATVQHYVSTAEPVGSKVLAQEYNLQVSPATVRQVMGVLEKAGLLFQPHTSAGRIPSDGGYRLYVDHLIQPSKATAQQVGTQLSRTLDWEGWSMEALLRGAAQILATLSGYLTLITVPQTSTARIRHVHLTLVGPEQILMVLLLNSLETQSMIVHLPHGADDEEWDSEALARELQILSNFLSTHLEGRSLSDIEHLDWGELGREFERYVNGVRSAIQTFVRRNQSASPAPFVISGFAEVLRQPEFSELQHMQSIVNFLEGEQAQLWPLVFETLPEGPSSRQLRVWIGSENPLEPMQGCALVSSTYTREEVPVGSISVLGPTRMVYEDAIAIVEAAADYLSTNFSANLNQ
ncbi:MAG: heat-inducible transcriptional repressor HrcA [Leptolyngbya sp. RL_3_1]|nr:heat-inducible transcriptional repressor HrcA [Leptolyngbya sp. RL_3_1]